MRERRERFARPSLATCGGSSHQARFSACSAAEIDGGDRDFAASIGSGLADAILQHEAEVGAVAEWLAANGVPAQTTDGAEDEDDERPAGEWLWVLEACMLVAAGSPDDLSDDQWKHLAAVYSALIPYVHDPFRWRRDEIGEPSSCWPPQGRLGGPAGSPGTGDGAFPGPGHPAPAR